MQLVINISEDLYKAAINGLNAEEIWDLRMAVKNGIPLPKGHGRLVDFSEVLIKLMQYYDGDKSIGQCLDEVNTIIEADGGDAE